eukprot:TRINITY_DN6326_c0_g3_i2.p1 TRINITY_DN6326_c0_g3~~TRINITY_DN6326_c0_g3_i2.p1  ORF type:complete len:536 (-),score=115.32 TRINITY_DN6326_c0_g3_i2:211-1818(-)
MASVLHGVKEHKAAGAAAGLLAIAAAGAYYRWRVLRGRRLKRPYTIPVDLADGDVVEDPQSELTRIVTFLQDTIVRPIDARMPGNPFTNDLLAFPFTPMVLVVGNHSAGKSTFINQLLGVSVQETGVAPTDDGFTVLERHQTSNDVDDGPTLLGCTQNRPFRELQGFGQAFWGHLRRKRMVLPKNSSMPYGLQIVDTPGMIDLPVKNLNSDDKYGGGRGYNFVEVVRWFAKRADLILLLFDPDKPGTTGEALDVLTKSLAGLDHKFLIILNKVDQLDSSVDFARAYGTLGWALSKVIPRKDIPMIYTMYNAGTGAREPREHTHKLPLEAFQKKREEVVAEVRRAKARHWDNVITSTEETLRQVEMVAKIVDAVRGKVRLRQLETQACGLLALVTPGVAIAVEAWRRFGGKIPLRGRTTLGILTAYGLVCYGIARFLQDHCQQFERLQVASLNTYFEEQYAHVFIHSDGEDVRSRWAGVKPRIGSILESAGIRGSVGQLLPVYAWEVNRVQECLDKDVWYLRQLAKRLREPESADA